MRKNKELKIYVEYTGIEPDLKPLARAIAERMRKEVNPDGTFIDPKLEAEYDQMTGLKNRRAYDEKLSWLAKNAPAEFYIVSADLNGLKKANDAIGHRAGDELITGAAECLSAAFEGIDTIYRTGGDEFCVIMTGPIAKAQLCIARLEDLMTQWKGRYNSSISISTGVASNENHDSIESIVAAADQNMYEYKRNYYISQGIDRRRR